MTWERWRPRLLGHHQSTSGQQPVDGGERDDHEDGDHRHGHDMGVKIKRLTVPIALRMAAFRPPFAEFCVYCVYTGSINSFRTSKAKKRPLTSRLKCVCWYWSRFCGEKKIDGWRLIDLNISAGWAFFVNNVDDEIGVFLIQANDDFNVALSCINSA